MQQLGSQAASQHSLSRLGLSVCLSVGETDVRTERNRFLGLLASQLAAQTQAEVSGRGLSEGGGAAVAAT